ncbi:MAG: hypothetical protein AB8H80_00030 [Planctomycetota bacterium]
MKPETSLWLLLGATLAAPLFAFWPEDQDPKQQDWTKHVSKACTASRFGIRVAAARKTASGGDAAVPAIRAWVQAHSRNDVPSSLVDAIADAKTGGDKVRDLLVEWANDTGFYWRGAAMRGLAQRRDESLKPLFDRFVNDPAWLTRTHARLGLRLLGGSSAGSSAGSSTGSEQATEADPRAVVRLARLLLENEAGSDSQSPIDLQPLIDALADERTFLGVPWGARLGQEANKALRQWLGDDYPKPDPDDQNGSIARLRDAAAKKSGQKLALPTPKRDATELTSKQLNGIEILSCKFGDQFVQWTDDGTLFFGIDGSRKISLNDADWQQLSKDRTPIALAGDRGVVVCDSLRVRLIEPKTHVKVAPSSLPKTATEWLKRLAQSLEEQDAADLAAELRRGLGQFAER